MTTPPKQLEECKVCSKPIERELQCIPEHLKEKSCQCQSEEGAGTPTELDEGMLQQTIVTPTPEELQKEKEEKDKRGSRERTDTAKGEEERIMEDIMVKSTCSECQWCGTSTTLPCPWITKGKPREGKECTTHRKQREVNNAIDAEKRAMGPDWDAGGHDLCQRWPVLWYRPARWRLRGGASKGWLAPRASAAEAG